MKESTRRIRVHRLLVYMISLFLPITILYACNDIAPHGYNLTQSTCIKEINTTNCPDSSLFHMLAKGRAFGPVGTYVIFASNWADSTFLECGSWTFNTNGNIFGCFRASNQPKLQNLLGVDTN